MFDSLFQKYITFKNIIFLIILIIAIKFIHSIDDIAIMFFASYVIACSFEPLVAKLSPKFGRTTASVLVLAGAIALVCGFFVPVVMLAGQEIKNFAENFPKYIYLIKDLIETIPFADRLALQNINVNEIMSSAAGMTSQVISETINVTKNISSAFVYLLASIIIIFYFMADKEKVTKTFLRFFPVPMRKQAQKIVDNISQKVGGYVVAQIITMTSVGIVMTLGLLFLGVEYGFLLGLMTAVLDLIPVVGPAIALVICLVVSYKSGAVVLALIVLIFSIAQLVENNLVRPYVFGKFLDLHPLIIYFFLFVTAKFLGIVGVIFAPAIAATAVVLIEEVYMKNIE